MLEHAHDSLKKLSFSVGGQALLSQVPSFRPEDVQHLVAECKSVVPQELRDVSGETIIDFLLDAPAPENQVHAEILRSEPFFCRVDALDVPSERFAPWFAFVERIIDGVEDQIELRDQRLEIKSVQLRYQPPAQTNVAKQPLEFDMHIDGGSYVVTLTWIGMPTVAHLGGLLFNVPVNTPFLFTGRKYRGPLRAIWHGQPQNYTGERFLMVLRLEPAPFDINV